MLSKMSQIFLLKYSNLFKNIFFIFFLVLLSVSAVNLGYQYARFELADRKQSELCVDTKTHTAWVAEKAVKIKDGITLNVKVTAQEFLDFIQDVVFTVVTESQTRAEIAQAAMAYFGRNSVTSVNVIDADFEEKE